MAVRPDASASARARASSRGSSIAQSASEPFAADEDRVAVDDAPHAEAGYVREVLRHGQRAEPRQRALGDGTGDRVLGGVLQRARQPQDFGLVGAVGGVHGEQGHPAGGDGAGLVEDDGVDLAGGLQDLRALDQDAQLGAAPGADQQRGRRGQAQGAGAGDDQYGDGGGERGRRAPRRCRARSRGCPGRGRSRSARRRRRSGRRAAGPRPCRSARPPPAVAIRASWVSAPTRVASTTRRPPALTVAPVTGSPTATSTGTDSPVSMEASTADEPSTTVPSVAIFSPGRTRKRSPTFSSATGTVSSPPPARAR